MLGALLLNFHFLDLVLGPWHLLGYRLIWAFDCMRGRSAHLVTRADVGTGNCVEVDGVVAAVLVNLLVVLRDGALSLRHNNLHLPFVLRIRKVR